MADVRYQFMAVGADGVAGSFRSIEQSAIRSKTAVEALFASMKAAPPKMGGFGPGSFKGGAGGGVDREVLAGIRREEQERERSLRHVAGIKERYLREEQAREEQADKRRERAILQRAQYQEREAEKAAKRPSWAARLAGGASRMGFDAAGGAAMAVTGAAVMAARQAYQLEEAATRISINARGKGEDFIDPRVLRREFQDTAAASPGVKAIDVAGAVQQYITVTGDLKTARKSQGMFATLASASGGDIGEIARMGGAISQQMGIKDIGEMKEVLGALVGQGKMGSFELRDAAAMYPRMMAAGAGFGVEKSARGVKTIGALSQIAMSGTGSGEVASTALENIFTAFKVKSEKFKAQGVNVYNEDGSSRDPIDLLAESVAQFGGKDIEKKKGMLAEAFGESGGRAVNPLVSTYADAYAAALKKGVSANEAQSQAQAQVKQKMTDFIDGAGDWKEVQKDAAKAQESAGARLTAAWERVVASASEELAPSLVNLVPHIIGLLPALKAVVEGFGMMATLAVKAADKLGLIAPKTVFEHENDSRKKLEEFDAAQPTGPLSPQKAAERARLQGVYNRAHDQAWGTAPKAEGFKDFSDWNAALGPEFGGVTDEKKKELYNDILKSPIKATADLNSGSGNMIDPVSRKAIQDLADQASASKATGGAVNMPIMVDTVAANKALADLAVAADDAARGFSRSPAGDPLGG